MAHYNIYSHLESGGNERFKKNRKILMKKTEKGRKQYCMYHLITVRKKEMHVYLQNPKGNTAKCQL